MLVKEVAEQSAQSVLDSYWPEGEFPVVPSLIASRLGIHIRVASLPENTSGAIMKRPGEDAQILIERSDSPVRQRFTAAHEIGHFIERTTIQEQPDEDFGFVDKRDNKHDLHEFFANEFAANLLMPRAEVEARVKDKYDAIRLAAHFGVSTIAAKTRLMKLGLAG